MRRLLLLVASLALVASTLLLGGSPARAQGLASYSFVPVQVFGTVAVGMPDERTVRVQHLDPATGQWDAPSDLVRTRARVTCGAVEGQASAGGVALLVECDRPYYEDQAPAHSIALVSRDGRSWSRATLPGEAYRPPAVSPAGTYAAWSVGLTGTYVEWSATSGFSRPARTTYRYDSGGETQVVDDSGTVTVIGAEPRGRACVIGIHTRDLAGSTTHTQVAGTDPGCTEGAFENVDALTVLGGGYERALQFTLSRPSAGAAWTVTRPAPRDVPGLVVYGYSRQRITTHFLYSSTPGSPIVATGSPDRHRVLHQVFDPVSQTWGPPVLVHQDRRRCADSYVDQPEGQALFLEDLRCGRAHVVLASADGQGWTVRDVGRRPWTATADGAALPGPRSTTVVRTDGVREFPVTTDGPCDVVQAGRAGELVRLHGPRGAWPSKVQVSTGAGFRTVSRAKRFDEPCRVVIVFPDGVDLNGPRHARDGRLVLRGGTWTFRYARGFLG